MSASIPAISENEHARLQALREYRILDTERETVFDELAELASIVCGCPMAQIALVDERRQWFKSRIGISLTETARDIAFCAHTVALAEMIVVKDASRDERFKSNPLVLQEPYIRFYAGAPLITPHGHALGALCVMDKRPRDLNFAQGLALRTLSRQVVTVLELRRATARLTKAMAQTEGKVC